MICTCKICGKKFNTYSALAIHTKWKHGPPRVHKCPICNSVFRDSFGVNRHIKAVHSPSYVERTTSCPLCAFSAPQNGLHIHFQDVHGITLVEENLSFDTVNDFMEWKKSMERETFSRYVKHRAPRKSKKAIVTIYYCYRDGQFKSHSKGLRALKKIGSNKLNAYCPACLRVRESDGRVTVFFRKTHVGHENDFVWSDDEEESENEAATNHYSSAVTASEPLNDNKTIVVSNNVKPMICEENYQMESISNLNENIAIMIEIPVPSISDQETLIKKKEEELKKIIEILDCVKTDEGLKAFQQHVAPLKSIVEDAEKKWCNFVSVDLEPQMIALEALSKPAHQENEGLIHEISIISAVSLTDQIQLDETLVSQQTLDHLEQLESTDSVMGDSHS